MRRRALALAGLATLPLLSACAGGDSAAEPVRIVFFEDDSIALSEPARAVVRDAADAARRFPNAPVRVLGFSAPDPTHAPTVSLSRARAERVVAELVAAGVPQGRIEQRGRGAVPFDALPVQSRRVEIHIGAH